MLRDIMEKSAIIILFHIGFGFWDICSGLPVDFSSVGTGKLSAIWLTSSLLLAVAFLIGIVSLIMGCICCRNGRGFQNEAKPVEEFSNSDGCLTPPVADGFVNPTSSEITIFPPVGVTSNVSSRSSIIHFEPLPNIKPQTPNLRPAAFSYSEQEISSQDWFYDPYNNFPRQQLKYFQEYGKGWFGRVVEGEAQNIIDNEKVTKVIVKILHEDATPTDQMYFLHEVKFYRDLKHPNILNLLGRCLETEPFLILLESCPNGDLKSFLTQNMASAQALVEQGVTLKMCSNITSGLQFMHEHKFIHTDLAARNCLVSPDLTIKIGDYGNSIEVFKSDYYCAGSVALPVRWCAPETLKCTDVTIETREVTPLANIWTLAVVFWEICEFCKLPYDELNDDQVIVRVLGEKNYFLQLPKMFCLYKDEMYHLMKLCWSPPLQRPTAAQIRVILENLLSSNVGTEKDGSDPRRLSQDFEQRWEKSKPNCIPKKDNSNEPVDGSHSITAKFKGAKVADSSYLDSPLGVFMLNKCKGHDPPRFCLKSETSKGDKNDGSVIESYILENKSPNNEPEEYFSNLKKSDSVKNLTGSLDRLNTVAQELQDKGFKTDFDFSEEMKQRQPLNFDPIANPDIDSWLKGVEVNNEDDETFVRKISEAIRDLDAALAMEKTSSSEDDSGKSSHQNSPGKNLKEGDEPVVVDFKLGGDTTSFINFIPKSVELSSLQNSEEPQSLNFSNELSNEKRKDFDVGATVENYQENSFANPLLDPRNSFKFKNSIFDESLKGNDSLLNVHSRNSSDTEDEIWRKRIEKGEFSEKVKEKSKSIADLMVLTHIDASDESDGDLDRSFDKFFNRGSYIRRHHTNPKTSLTSNNFGSENDLTNAVLEDTFKESLKKLSNDHKEYGRFDSLGMILPTSVDRENVWGNILRKSSSEENLAAQKDVSANEEIAKRSKDPSEVLQGNDSDTRNNFLGNTASEKLGNLSPDDSASLINTSPVDCKITSNNDWIGLDEPNCDKSKLESELVLNGSSQACGNLQSEHLKKSDNDGQKPENPVCDLELGRIESEEDIKESESGETKDSSADVRRCSIIPEIKVSEEPPDTFEEEPKNSAVAIPQLRPFKFVLKDEECTKMKRAIVEESQKPSDNETSEIISDVERVEKRPDFLNGKHQNLVENGGVEVIIGACEDYTLDYFKGLKTTFGNEEEMFRNIPGVTINKDVNLYVWDKHLEKSITQMLDNANFDDINFFNLNPGKEDFSSMRVIPSDNSISTSPNSSLTDDNTAKEKKNEGFTNLNGNTSEEEYENSKLRTPDDERSSDSGFRDKGSLSESVEDACEGKYNLEDIEAELEEAFVKGGFTGETGKETPKETNNFEYEETKFYEDENKNEDDFSDIDGEIEFWQNQETSDYYPEISEFNPVNSYGWYLHPPDENPFTPNENVNEEFVNALRDELRQKLPVQSRSFHKFSEDVDATVSDISEDDRKYVTNLSAALSPILEEQDHDGSEPRYFPVQDVQQKPKKNVTGLMESGKSVDTDAFIHYLDYMVETEGKDIDEAKSPFKIGQPDDILVVNTETNVVTLLESPSESRLTLDRSLSDPSRSSNGSRAEDISEVTISSPENLSECYLTPDKSPFESPDKSSEAPHHNGFINKPEEYEMSTSFMGDNLSDEEDDVEVESDVHQTKISGNEPSNDWDSLSSGCEEELSSSSGEFIWKDGDKESRVKVKRVTDSNEALFEDQKLTSDEGKSAAGEDTTGDCIVKEIDKDCNECDDFTDSEDDRDGSSTGSSASITDFVPSAWNSQATPSRPALRSPDKKTENNLSYESQKRNVWFKKQKYHCIYEYPREPSDTESAGNSPQRHFNYEIDPSDGPSKYFTYGINNKVNLNSQYFAYGLSDLIGQSSFAEWGSLNADDPEAESEKGGFNAVKTPDYYNLNLFDYDFNGSGSAKEDEFFVSSSTRPFQCGSSSQFYPNSNHFTMFKDAKGDENASHDFVTPDSGVEDLTNATPVNKTDESTESGDGDSSKFFENLKFSFVPEKATADLSNGLVSSSPQSPKGLGELRHARDKLKLDLPLNHNIDLDITVGKNKIEEITQN